MSRAPRTTGRKTPHDAERPTKSADVPAAGLPSAPATRAAQVEAMRQQRLWPEGSLWPCPACGKKAFRGRDDLHKEVPRDGVVHIFRGLKGASCEACHAQSLEPFEDIAIEGVVLGSFVADYDARVTNIGRDTVGTYWPRDVQRLTHMRKGRKLRVQVLDVDTLLVRLLPDAE